MKLQLKKFGDQIRKNRYELCSSSIFDNIWPKPTNPSHFYLDNSLNGPTIENVGFLQQRHWNPCHFLHENVLDDDSIIF